MKKILFIAPLMSISFLASCDNIPIPKVDVEFTATTATLDEYKTTANISLDWTPTEHSIECSDFTFTLNNQKISSTVTPVGEAGSRPLNLSITFNSPLNTDDKGDLKFNYIDKTAKKEGEGEVTGIDVKLPIDPPGPVVHHISMVTEGTDIVDKDLPTDKNYESTINVITTGKLLNGLVSVTLKDGNDTDITGACEYSEKEDKKSAGLIINLEYLTSDIEVAVNLTDEPEPTKKWYEYEDWWNYCSNGVEGEEATEDDISQEVEIEFNDYTHKVHLIDIDHDMLADGVTTVHCTFEFVSFIRGDDKNKITCYWNGEDDMNSTNYNFIEHSDLNAYLNEGGAAYQAISETQPEFFSVIKTVKKEVEVSTNSGNSYDSSSYFPKLFPLSHYEIYNYGGDDADKCYSYYKDNDSSKRKKEDWYWLRSPLTDKSVVKYEYKAWRIKREDGSVLSDLTVGNASTGIAPAFCI